MNETDDLTAQVRATTEKAQALLRTMKRQIWINGAFMALGSFMGTLVGTFLYLWFKNAN